MLDLAIIGSGPAALSSAIYAARAGLSVEVYEKQVFGGALNKIEHIENYPGFIGKGEELAKVLKSQAEKFGVKLKYGSCESVEPLVIDGEKVEARAILVATGTEPRPLDFAVNPPVSYCVACDGALYQGKNVAVVGGGNSAVQESIHLAKIVKSLTLICHSSLRAEACLTKKLRNLKNVEILENIEPTPEKLNNFDAVFVLIGSRPATKFLPENLCDEQGYVKAENHQTAQKNLFVAGDVRRGSIHQAISAAADGAAAAREIINFVHA